MQTPEDRFSHVEAYIMLLNVSVEPPIGRFNISLIFCVYFSFWLGVQASWISGVMLDYCMTGRGMRLILLQTVSLFYPFISFKVQ